MARTSTATATWNGKLKDGKGTFSAQSGAFRGEYSFGTRFGDAAGTNPEELIASAHAACFSMALAVGLEKGGHAPKKITTTAHCTIDSVDGGSKITTMKLETRGSVPGIDQKAFAAAADGAKQNCPVSRALAGNVQITLDANLEA
jgi:osmotically inducible protein OsmC